MHKQMRSLRTRILNKCPPLSDSDELKKFFTKSGDVSDIRKLAKSEYEKDSEENTTSSSEDEDNLDTTSIQNLDRDSLNYNDKSELGRTHSVN